MLYFQTIKKAPGIFTILTIFIFSVSSCKTKQIYTEVVKTDTLIVTKEIIKTLPVANYIEVDKPCDSLGNLKPIFLRSNTGKNSVVVSSNNGKLQISTQIDSTKTESINSYQSSLDSKVIVKEKRFITKWVWYSLLINVVLLVWTFRKFII